MKNIFPFITLYQKSLGRWLFLILLLSSLLPMILVSVIHYHNSRQSMLEKIHRHLEEVSAAKTAELNRYFNRMIAKLNMLAEMRQNVRFLEDLQKMFAESGQGLDEFVRSQDWLKLAEQGADLALFRRTFGVSDIYLLDIDGNILFSVAGNDDLGANLFNGDFSDSNFAKACRMTEKTGKPAFADYARYVVSDPEKPYAFLAVPVQNDNGERIGIMAFQLKGMDIDAMLHSSMGTGEEIYLISRDGRRSTSRLDPSIKFLDPMEETMQVSLWRKEHLNPQETDNANLLMKEDVMAYQGYHGKPVFGLHRSLVVAGTPFALIAEVEQRQAMDLVAKLRQTVFFLVLATGLLVFVIVAFYAEKLVQPILQLVEQTKKVAVGDFDLGGDIRAKFELAELVSNFKIMQASLQETAARERRNSWRRNGMVGLNDIMRGEVEITELAGRVSSFLAEYLESQVAAFFILAGDVFVFSAGYACKLRDLSAKSYAMGEGLIGQAAQEKKSVLFTDLPAGHLPLVVNSGLGESAPVVILAVPLLYEEQTLGVIELGRVSSFTEEEMKFLEKAAANIGIVLSAAMARTRTNELLAETQRQGRELQHRQQELKAVNEELEKRNKSLQEQKLQIARAMEEVDQKARELAAASKYKSEFLANMSHELRSPLNSLLILARELADNKGGNLTPEQVKEAEIIHNSGKELLRLINDILDLSKVEAGQLDIHTDEIYLPAFCRSLDASFTPQAVDKGVDFRVECGADLPAVLFSDEQRLGQILKNLIANALKFTVEGEVVLRIEPVPGNNIAFIVSDTGIGIAPEKQQAIFAAFQQADGSTTRKYGGTGLGLTISRKLASLLDSTITVESVPGKGATFTLFVPARTAEARLETGEDIKTDSVQFFRPPDSEATDRPGEVDIKICPDCLDKKILIVDDDMRNTFALGNLLRKTGLKVVMAADGEQALKLLQKNPDINLVLMDMMMPKMDGYEAIARIRSMEVYKELPIIALTAKAMSEDRKKCLAAGATDYLAKPVSREKLFAMIEQIMSHGQGS